MIKYMEHWLFNSRNKAWIWKDDSVIMAPKKKITWLLFENWKTKSISDSPFLIINLKNLIEHVCMAIDFAFTVNFIYYSVLSGEQPLNFSDFFELIF